MNVYFSFLHYSKTIICFSFFPLCNLSAQGNLNLPEILKMENGDTVSNVVKWETDRRPETINLFREHVYGRSPDKPDDLSFKLLSSDPNSRNGNATLKNIEISFSEKGSPFSFTFHLYIPNNIAKPVPLFLLLNHRGDNLGQADNPFFSVDLINQKGYGAAILDVQQLSPDDNNTYRDGVLNLYDGPVEPGPNSWRQIAAWAWGGSRVMDYLETDNEVDPTKVAIVGHSRGGKTALWAGAEDQRFNLVISNNSGCTGAALARNKKGERVAVINNNFPRWFATNYKQYNDLEENLPIDQHQLIGLIAPRLAYVASAETDNWADQEGEFLATIAATPVYELYGLEGMTISQQPGLDMPSQDGYIGYHIRTGSHNLLEYDWEQYLNYGDKFLKDFKLLVSNNTIKIQSQKMFYSLHGLQNYFKDEKIK